MRNSLISTILLLLISIPSHCEIIIGILSSLKNQHISLKGVNGFETYTIATNNTDENGKFKLEYSKSNYGIGFIETTDKKSFLVLLCGENIEITGESLNAPETIKISKGKENQYFEQYANEHPRREQSLSAWTYLEKIYETDPLFKSQNEPNQAIQKEKKRVITEDAEFLNQLPKNSYVSWFLPTRKLVSSVSTVAQYRTEEIPSTIAAFRALDYADARLYKSGLLKDAIESHFWLIENSGMSLDSVFVEMKQSIDAMLVHLIKDDKKLNEVTNYLFDLLERHSLFQASEYLALKLLNETSCTLNSDLAKQLESYRAMKKGNIAPEIDLGKFSYLNGFKQEIFNSLSNLPTPYTLVVFGASWCPKCAEELPKIIKNYVKWRNSGVEVVYISLDTEKDEFAKTVKTYPFFTYCDFKKWEGSVVKNYYVFGTPTFYLLNNKREILLRPNSVSQIDAWVDWYLIQGNK